MSSAIERMFDRVRHQKHSSNTPNPNNRNRIKTYSRVQTRERSQISSSNKTEPNRKKRHARWFYRKTRYWHSNKNTRATAQLSYQNKTRYVTHYGGSCRHNRTTKEARDANTTRRGCLPEGGVYPKGVSTRRGCLDFLSSIVPGCR